MPLALAASTNMPGDRGGPTGATGPTGPTGPTGAIDADWRALDAELDAWAAAGRQAPIWWRDDDAVSPGPALDRLIAGTGALGAPLTLAVIPANAGPDLADRLAARDAAHVTVAQHGWTHQNHAPTGQKKAELGDHRPAATVWAELADGRQRLSWLFATRMVDMLVPPWNRIGQAVAGGLARLGYTAISLFDEDRPPVGQGVTVVNTHCDPIAWRGDRGLSPAALGDLTRALAAARASDAPAPVGLLTHHLDQDEAVWAFVDRLGRQIDAHPGARWCAPTVATA